MLYVDGVSSIASVDFQMDKWGVDLAVSGSQKGFMLPAGLAIMAFENTGKTPLIIHSVKAACGCTVLKGWPKHPIMPGESGEIPIEFNPKSPGSQRKFGLKRATIARCKM